MVFVRRRLPWLICAWLTFQIAGVAAAPIVFCCKDVPTTEDEQACCAGLAPGQLCPMHHKTAGKSECKMRNACAPADAMLVALAGGVGVLRPATAVVNAFDPGDVVAPAAPSPIARTSSPESPPPRA